MEDNNQSKSSPSPSNDNQSTPATENSSEQLAPSQPKSFKAFGTYNPNLTQDVQHVGEQNIAPTGNASGNQTQYSQTYGSPAGYNVSGQQNNSQPIYGAPSAGPIQPMKHSGLGITSFIFSIVAVLVIVIGIIVLFSSMTSLSLSELELMQDPAYLNNLLLNNDGSLPSGVVGIIVGVLLMFSSGLFGFLGLIFGIISVCMKNRRKIFGIIGTILNALLVIGGFVFFVVSLLASGL